MNANKTIIYLRKIILLAIEEDVLVFKSCFFFLLCSIFYDSLITNKQIKSFNKIGNLKTFSNISNVPLVSRAHINYLEFVLHV